MTDTADSFASHLNNVKHSTFDQMSSGRDEKNNGDQKTAASKQINLSS